MKIYEVLAVRLEGCEGKNSHWERIGVATTKAEAEKLIEDFTKEKTSGDYEWWMDWGSIDGKAIETKIVEMK